MMTRRSIVLDAEMTGLPWEDGHRIVEIAALELADDKMTDDYRHFYINPQRNISENSFKIHGLDESFLADKPLFSDIAGNLRAFIGNSPVIITCRTASDGRVADIIFLNGELERAKILPIPTEQWINVRLWSEAMFGNKKATLNAVLDRYGIDRIERSDQTGHGALLDSRLLARAYPFLKSDFIRYNSSSDHGKPERPAP